MAASIAPAALAAPAAKPTVPAGYTITKLADAPKGAGNCDDLTSLEGHLFMTCQNKTLSNGGGGMSTIVEYSAAGAVLKSWSLKDKADGIGGDPLHHRVLVTLNEDAASHLVTITPSAAPGQQIADYSYSPDPRAASTPVALRTGGGTDQVSVDSAGNIFLTASHAGTKTGTAVFKAVLTPPSSPGGTGTATLSPTFLDNAMATNGNKGTGMVKLSLGDVDSGAIVPQSSPRFAGDYVIADQTALQLVFANLFTGSGVTALKTPFGLDDIRWATSDGGTLYVVDKGATANLPATSVSALYKVSGPFVKNTVLAANDGVGDQVVTVNLNSGALTPLVRGLNTTKGLVYLDPSGSEAQLPLSGSTPVSSANTATKAKSSGGSDNTALIVIIVVGLLLLGGAGFAIARRGKRAG